MQTALPVASLILKEGNDPASAGLQLSILQSGVARQAAPLCFDLRTGWSRLSILLPIALVPIMHDDGGSFTMGSFQLGKASPSRPGFVPWVHDPSGCGDDRPTGEHVDALHWIAARLVICADASTALLMATALSE